jgi:hypothetical protein
MSKHDKVAAKLRQTRKQVLNRPEERILDVIGTIQVAKDGSVHHYEKLAVVAIEGAYRAIQYNGSSFKEEWCYSLLRSSQVCVHTITDTEAMILAEAIGSYHAEYVNDLQPYTWVKAFCLARGYDVKKYGLLK